MTGKYDIEIYNKRVHYHLTVKRNITVIQGDSATGKTEPGSKSPGLRFPI